MKRRHVWRIAVAALVLALSSIGGIAGLQHHATAAPSHAVHVSQEPWPPLP